MATDITGRTKTPLPDESKPGYYADDDAYAKVQLL